MSDFYTVEKILAKDCKDGQVKYLVKWLGYTYNQSTWEPFDNLSGVTDMIEEFEVRYKSIKQKKVSDSILETNLANNQTEISSNSQIKRKRKRKDTSKDLDTPEETKLQTIQESSNEKQEKQIIVIKEKELIPEKIIIKESPEENVLEIEQTNQTNQANQLYPTNLSKINQLSKVQIPEKILKIKKSCNQEYVKVKWKIRPDGIEYDDSLVLIKEIKEHYPKLLLEFYETKIKIKLGSK